MKNTNKLIRRILVKNLGFFTCLFGVLLVTVLKSTLVNNVWIGIIPTILIVFSYITLYTLEVFDNPKAHWLIRRVCKADMIIGFMVIIFYFGIITDILTGMYR